MRPTLVDVLLSDPDGLDALAAALAPRLPRPTVPAEDGWLNMKQAAAYLGMSSNALQKYTAAREVPFEQDTPGGKCWFKRSELDEWRRA